MGTTAGKRFVNRVDHVILEIFFLGLLCDLNSVILILRIFWCSIKVAKVEGRLGKKLDYNDVKKFFAPSRREQNLFDDLSHWYVGRQSQK